MQFNHVADPFGTAPAFQTVAYPMLELQNKKLVRKVKRSLRMPAAPNLSKRAKNFLLTYNG